MATSWWVVRGPNGGYLAAVILRALTDAVDDPERTPRSLTVHYASSPGEGDVAAPHRARARRALPHDVHVPHGAGRQARRARGRRVLEAASGPGVLRHRHAAGARARALRPRAGAAAKRRRSRRRYETRWAIGHPPVPGTPTGARAVAGGWIRLPEHRPVDALARRGDHRRLAPADVQPDPGAGRRPDRRPHDPLPRRAARTPASADDAFVLASFRTTVAADGFLEEDGEIWAPDGTLLAQSRQFATILPLA